MAYRGILIDPFTETVAEIELQDGLQGWYDAIQARPIDLRRITDAGDTIVVDDEGHFRQDQRYFQLNLDPTMWAGRALIVGPEVEEKTTSTRLPLSLIQRTVHFHPAGTQYEPPAPVVTSFETFDDEMAKALGWNR